MPRLPGDAPLPGALHLLLVARPPTPVPAQADCEAGQSSVQVGNRRTGMSSSPDILPAMLNQLITRIYLRSRLATDYGLLFDDSQPFIEHKDKLVGKHFLTYFTTSGLPGKL